MLEGGVADAALGDVDDALEGEVVGRVGDDAEIGDGVADFAALVEVRAADDAVVEAEGDEALFELAHLVGGADEDRHVVEVLALALELLDLFADLAGFLLAVPDRRDADLVAFFADVGLERLAEADFVVGDEVGGGAEDVGGRAVVALELDDLGAGKILLEAEDVVDLGAAPAVDRLVVVADDADIGFARGLALREEAQPEVLGDVAVLVLVDEDVAEAAVVLGEDLRVLAEEADVLEQQVAEVGGVERLEAGLVVRVELLALAVGELRGVGRRSGPWAAGRGSSSCPSGRRTGGRASASRRCSRLRAAA